LLLAAWLLCQPWLACSGDFSQSVVPPQIDVTAYNGFMIYGAFGSPAGCFASNMVFVKDTYPQYKLIYATMLTAVSASGVDGWNPSSFALNCDGSKRNPRVMGPRDGAGVRFFIIIFREFFG
jgi:hypothetical protein